MNSRLRILRVIVPAILYASVVTSTPCEPYASQALDQLISSIESAPAPESVTPTKRIPISLIPPRASVNWENPPIAADAMACDPNRLPAIQALWIGGMPWLGGNPISGGVTFFNSIGREMPGSIESSLTPEQYVPIEIRFDPAETTYCQTYRIETNWGPSGVGVFPGSAWDMTNPGSPRRLNLCFSEYNDNAGPIPPPNFFWDPDSTRSGPTFGKFEFVFIMLSDYDGTGLTYAGVNPFVTDQDMLYFWYPRLLPGHTWFETLPAAIQIKVFHDYVTDQLANAGDQQLSLQWTYCGDGLHTQFRILRGTGIGQPPVDTVAYVPAGTASYKDSGLVNGTTYTYRIEVLGPGDSLMGYSPNFNGTAELLAQNMSLLGRWSWEYAPIDYGGLWGYVDPDDGHEYALLTFRNGGVVTLIDLDTPTPTQLTSFNGSGSDTKEVKTYRDYVFVLSEYGPIEVYDLSGLPIVYGDTWVSSINPAGGGSHNLLIDGHYLYVVGNHAGGGLEIFDIINPAAPVKVGQFQPFYYHDITIRRDTIYAYGIYGNGIDIIDVSNKTAPRLISRFNYPGSGAHNGELSADGKYLFIGDEIGSGPRTRVFDVSDPLNVEFVTDMMVDPLSISHNCYRRGDILYIAHYDRGVRAWNISDPENPYEAGFYDTNPNQASGFDGAWTAYPMPSGRIIVSDMTRGLFVLSFDGIETPSCVCDCHGDPECDGMTNVADVVRVINTAFSGNPATDPVPGCSAEMTDLDCNGATNIIDVIKTINITFRNANPLWEICKPCYP